MSERDSSNTHQVISEVFRTMNVKRDERAAAKLPRWAVADDEERGALGMHYTSVPNILKVLEPLTA